MSEANWIETNNYSIPWKKNYEPRTRGYLKYRHKIPLWEWDKPKTHEDLVFRTPKRYLSFDIIMSKENHNRVNGRYRRFRCPESVSSLYLVINRDMRAWKLNKMVWISVAVGIVFSVLCKYVFYMFVGQAPLIIKFAAWRIFIAETVYRTSEPGSFLFSRCSRRKCSRRS